MLCSGHPKEGRVAIEKSIRLDPRDPMAQLNLMNIAISYFLSGEYEAAVEAAKRVIRAYPWKRAQRFRWVEVRRLRFADLLGAHPLGFLTSEFIRTYQLHRSLKRQSRQAIGLLLKLSAANFEGCASAISMGWHHTYGHALRPFAGGIWGESKAEALCFRWLRC